MSAVENKPAEVEIKENVEGDEIKKQKKPKPNNKKIRQGKFAI